MLLDLSQQELMNRLDYDSNTGKFTWKIKPSSKVNVGDPAGKLDKRGYVVIGINGKHYKAHRLAWLYVYGKWPDAIIDHINGITGDNRICNLRDVSHRTNCMNQICHRNGKLCGAVYVEGANKWESWARINGKRTYIKRFETEAEAHEAYLSAVKGLSE
jgi:hypothetical protein